MITDGLMGNYLSGQLTDRTNRVGDPSSVGDTEPRDTDRRGRKRLKRDESDNGRKDEVEEVSPKRFFLFYRISNLQVILIS